MNMNHLAVLGRGPQVARAWQRAGTAVASWGHAAAPASAMPLTLGQHVARLALATAAVAFGALVFALQIGATMR